jgi:flagellar L-ring protein precursor FlgH
MTIRVPLVFLAAGILAWSAKKPAPPSAVDDYIREALGRGTSQVAATPGSLWTAGAPLADVGRDLRASRVDDIVTVLVVERASATASGTVDTSRSSSASASITALGGVTKAAGRLANLAGLQGDQRLKGDGSTSREAYLSTTLAARITHVLPNGYLVVEGSKSVQVNAETQLVRVRGVANPVDLAAGNLIRSDRLAQLEVSLNGKGVVGDAVRRPFFLYRLLLGLLPF